MTALTIIQRASSRLGLVAPNVVFSSTSNNVIKLRNLMNEACEELAKEHTWQALQSEHTFVTVAAALQTLSVPSDFNWYLNDTMWNRTTAQQVRGPLSAAEWQREQVSPTIGALGPAFMFRGGDIYLSPTPTAGDTVAYEYMSINCAETSGGTGISEMTADTDVALLPEDLLVLSVQWRFKASLGLDYGELFRTYEIAKAKAIARDGGKKSFLLHQPGYDVIHRGNIPEGSW